MIMPKIVTTTAILLLFLEHAAFGQNSFFPKSFSASFTQILKSELNGKEKKSYGTIEYRYPGSIRVEIESPDPLTFVRNEHNSWYYTPPFIEGEAGQVTLNSGNKFGLTAFFDVLNLGLLSNDRYTVVTKPDSVQLVFSAKFAKEMDIKSATISFQHNIMHDFVDTDTIEITRVGGKKSKLILSKIIKNPKLSDERFIFRIPPNTRTTR